jgi:DNA-binding MurR/RpiR family transcriptional regulator
MTVRSRIEQHLAKLSNAERQIARLVIENYPMSALGDIKDIAGLAFVSPPTITRFVRRLGYERFVDFQRAIRLEVQDREASPLALLKQHRAKPPTRDAELFTDIAKSLAQLNGASVQDALNKAAALLGDGKRRISLLGGRWSSVAAQYLSFQLTSLRGDVHALLPQASGLVADRIADFGKKDVLVVYDFRRYQPATYSFAEASAKRGARIILFTDDGLSPICDLADVMIPVTVATTSPLDTLVPAIAATDALLARLVSHFGASAAKRMVMLEHLRKATSGEAEQVEESS